MREKSKLLWMFVLIGATLVMWRCASPGTAPVNLDESIVIHTNRGAPPAITNQGLPSPALPADVTTNASPEVRSESGARTNRAAVSGMDLILADVRARNPEALRRLSAISQDLHGALKRGEGSDLFSGFREIFEKIGELAGQGELAAYDFLVQASADPFLQGAAVKALGEAARLGNENALEMLLAAGENGLLESGTLDALKPAAEAGNERAIAGIASFAYRTNAPLYNMTVSALEPAAIQGNRTAIEAIREIARRDESQAVAEARRVLRRVGEPQ